MVGVFGELDNLIPLDNIVRMVDVLAENRKSFDVRVYPDAPHGFLNDTMPGPLPGATGASGMEPDHYLFRTVFSAAGSTRNARFGASRATLRFTTISPK